jgi:O-antigen/teichoic acid export membrane protein
LFTPGEYRGFFHLATRAGRWQRSRLLDRLQQAAQSNSLLTLIDQVIYSASNFLTAVIVARAGAAHEFGLFFLGLRITDYFREIGNVLIWSPYMFLSPQLRQAEHARYTGSTLIHQVGFSFLGALLLIFTTFLLPSLSQPAEVVSAMWPLALVAAMVPLQEYSRRICFANLQTTAVIVFDGIVTLLQLGGLALLAHTGRLSVKNAYWLIGAANGAAALCWVVWARGDRTLAKDQVLPDFQRNFAMGKWLLGGNLTLLAGQQVFPWSLGVLHGAAATGAYAASEGVINFIRAFMISVQNHLGPSLAHAWARGGAAQLQRVVQRSTLLLGIVVGGLCAITALLGGTLVRLIYGNQYKGLQLLVALLAANIFVQAITISHAYALSAADRPEINFKINLIGLGLCISVGLILVKSFGPLGAAIGLLLASLIASLLRCAAYSKHVIRVKEKP